MDDPPPLPKKNRSRRHKKRALPTMPLMEFQRQTQVSAQQWISVEERAQEEMAQSVAMQQAEASRIKSQEALALETEAFLWNLAWTATATQLVEFLSVKLRDLGVGFSHEHVVVRCQLMEKGGRNTGCAVVLFSSKRAFDAICSLPPSALMFLNRLIGVKEGNGGSKHRRRVNHSSLISFAYKEVQLALPAKEHSARCPLEWTTSSSGPESLLTVDPSKGLLTLKLTDLTMAQKELCVVISIKSIHSAHVCMGRDKSNGNIVLHLHLRERPKLLGVATNVFVDLFAGTIFERSLLSDLAAGITNSSRLWELDINTAVRNEVEYIRTVDPTPLAVFGRCLVYRIVMAESSQPALMNLWQTFSNFGLLPSIPAAHLLEFGGTVMRPYSLLNNAAALEQSAWGILSESGLTFSTLYWLHVLVGCNKLDLVSLHDSLPALAARLLCVDQTLVHMCLHALFLDPTLLFIFDFEKTFQEVLQKQSPLTFLDPVEDDYEDDPDEEEQWGKGSFFIRRVLVTPLCICPQPEELDQSSRVLRAYATHKERFLRITFVDENYGSVLQAQSADIFEKRLRPLLHSGLLVGGRPFVFLAYANSQLREQSVWFYDETSSALLGAPGIPTAQDIRDSIGDLSTIRLIGKFAARLGQGFSGTVPASTHTVNPLLYGQVADVKNHGYCFSDGVGMIAQSYADQISKDDLSLTFTASAFQVRWGGAKGVLTLVPDHFLPEGKLVLFRPSMLKFPSTSKELGINNYSRALPFYLNRQLITVLSARGVADASFIRLVEDNIFAFDEALRKNGAAQQMLRQHTDVGVSHMSLTPATSVWFLLEAGMSVTTDVYVYRFALAVRNSLLQGLQDKARVFIPKGVMLIGVMDETHTLLEGEVFVQLSNRQNTSGKAQRPLVLTHPFVVIGRNPSLHPGMEESVACPNFSLPPPPPCPPPSLSIPLAPQCSFL